MDDLIRRSDAIEAIEVVDWYHQNRNKDMVSGANSDEHQAWYKADDVYKALEAVPSADRPQGDFVSKRYILAEIDDLADEFSEVDENGLHGERWCGILDSKGIIVNAPSVSDRPQEWIPCSERLPTKEEQDDELGVLVTLGNGYSGLQFDYYYNGLWDDWNGYVFAWMPLPEPWKGADDE